MIFDNAFIPWENVLVYRDVKKATGLYAQSGFMPRYMLQSGTRLAVKLDFLCGLFARALEANGTGSFRGVQAKFGELVGWRNLIWALTDALCYDPMPGPGGTRHPQDRKRRADPPVRHPGVPDRAGAVRRDTSAARRWSFRRATGPPERRAAPGHRPFYRGSAGDAHDRIKLFKLIWDAVGSEFGSRHEWYEINYSGNQEQMRLDMARFSGGRGILADCDALVEQCMSEYDLDGWTGNTWLDVPGVPGVE